MLIYVMKIAAYAYICVRPLKLHPQGEPDTLNTGKKAAENQLIGESHGQLRIGITREFYSKAGGGV